MNSANYYEILGVSSSASQEEIKRAYRNMAKEYHPDINHSANATVFFRLIQEAYEVLSDPVKRANMEQDTYNENTSSESYEEPFYENEEKQTSYYDDPTEQYEEWKFRKASYEDINELRRKNRTLKRIILRTILFPLFFIVSLLDCLFIMAAPIISFLCKAGFVLFIALTIFGIYLSMDSSSEITWKHLLEVVAYSLLSLCSLFLFKLVARGIRNAATNLGDFIHG